MHMEMKYIHKQIDEICQYAFAISDIKIVSAKTQYKFLQAPAGMLLFSTGWFNHHNHSETSLN